MFVQVLIEQDDHQVACIRFQHVHPTNPCNDVILLSNDICIPRNYFLPYRIVNMTNYIVSFHQNTSSRHHEILPFHTMDYSWDEPLGPLEILLRVSNAMTSYWEDMGVFQLNYFDSQKTLHLSNGQHLVLWSQVYQSSYVISISLHQTNSCLHLIASDERSHQRLERRHDETAVMKVVNCDEVEAHHLKSSIVTHESTIQPMSRVLYKLQVLISSLCITLIDHKPQELLCIYLRNVHAKYLRNELEEQVQLTLSHFQMDCQLHCDQSPCIIHPLKYLIENYRDRDMDQRDDVKVVFLSLEVHRNKSHCYQHILYLSLIRWKVMPLNICLDGIIVLPLIECMRKVIQLVSKFQYKASPRESQKMSSSSSTEPMIFIEKLELESLDVNLSFNPLVAIDSLQDSEVDEDKVDMNHMMNYSTIYFLMNILNEFIRVLGSTLMKLENCNLHFQTFRQSNLFLRWRQLNEIITQHLIQQLIWQSFSLIGSLQAIGNVSQIYQNLNSGLYDFISMPLSGLISMSPKKLFHGFILGSLSLSKRLIVSCVSIIGNISSSIDTGLQALTSSNTVITTNSDGRSFRFKLGWLAQFRRVGNTILNICVSYGLRPWVGMLIKMSNHISYKLLPRHQFDYIRSLHRIREPRVFLISSRVSSLWERETVSGREEDS